MGRLGRVITVHCAKLSHCTCFRQGDPQWHVRLHADIWRAVRVACSNAMETGRGPQRSLVQLQGEWCTQGDMGEHGEISETARM